MAWPPAKFGGIAPTIPGKKVFAGKEGASSLLENSRIVLAYEHKTISSNRQ